MLFRHEDARFTHSLTAVVVAADHRPLDAPLAGAGPEQVERGLLVRLVPLHHILHLELRHQEIVLATAQ
jgi:hypothetical protein